MHFSLSCEQDKSHLSTPSDILEASLVSPEFEDAWFCRTFDMAEQMYTGQYGRLSATSQEWTPSSAVRYCTVTEPHIHHGDESETIYSQNHQVSSFNLPLICDSTLTTPVSLNPESPSPHGKALPSTQWNRTEHPSLQYQLRSNDSIYDDILHNTSMSMKKDESLTLPTPDSDSMLSISPYVFDTPQTPCPPTPYWGSFSVSAPLTASSSTTTNTPSAGPQPNLSVSSSSRSQAPIILAPTPSSRRPLQRAPDERLGHQQQQHQHQQQYQQGRPIQVKLQNIHQQPRSPIPQIKRECTSPTSKANKRHRRSIPPAEQQKPLKREDLSEEDKLLLHLRDIKENEKWDWKELTDRFNKETGGKHNLAALQMRYTRLVERMRVWTDIEIQALQRAKVQYDNQKWKTIAESMLEYGCETKWSPHACQLKWQELYPCEGEYDYNTDPTTTATTSPPQRNDSSISLASLDKGDVADDGNGGVDSRNPHRATGPGDGGIMAEQAAQSAQLQLQIRQRGSGGGKSGRGSGGRSLYEQRQDWTVRPQH